MQPRSRSTRFFPHRRATIGCSLVLLLLVVGAGNVLHHHEPAAASHPCLVCQAGNAPAIVTTGQPLLSASVAVRWNTPAETEASPLDPTLPLSSCRAPPPA